LASVAARVWKSYITERSKVIEYACAIFAVVARGAFHVIAVADAAATRAGCVLAAVLGTPAAVADTRRSVRLIAIARITARDDFTSLVKTVRTINRTERGANLSNTLPEKALVVERLSISIITRNAVSWYGVAVIGFISIDTECTMAAVNSVAVVRHPGASPVVTGIVVGERISIVARSSIKGVVRNV